MAHAPTTATATATVVAAATARRRRRRRARGEPGMAMLLVLILIVMVTAAGVFAAQSTSMEVRSAGFARQAAQTHYVAESGVVASLDELRRSCASYKYLMDHPAQTPAVPAGLLEAPKQYAFYLTDFNRLTATSALFAAPSVTTAGARVEGSLGPGRLQPGFAATSTLLYEVPDSAVGYFGNWIHVYAFEFASNGRTELAGVTDARGNTIGTEAARVLAQIPCI